MAISFRDASRRDDLRSAALFVVDRERQEHGYDKRVEGSANVADVFRIFEESLATRPLEEEVGYAIRTPAEISGWRKVLDRLGPMWKLWRDLAACPQDLLATAEWEGLRQCVAECVATHSLWHEEVRYPVDVGRESGSVQAANWDVVSSAFLGGTTTSIRDADGRPLEVEPAQQGTARLVRVGLPRPI